MREVPLSHSCRQTGWCISGGRTPADRGHDIRRAGDCPWQGKNIPMLFASAQTVFAWGNFSVRTGGVGQGRARVSPCRRGWRSGRSGRPGWAVWKFFCAEGHADSQRGMSARLRCSANFFRTACEKKAQSGRCKNIFYDTRLPGSGGQGLLPLKAGKSAIARKKILPAVKKT